jgi:hypothetical protein
VYFELLDPDLYLGTSLDWMVFDVGPSKEVLVFSCSSVFKGAIRSDFYQIIIVLFANPEA